jgi:hypothetical protein
MAHKNVTRGSYVGRLTADIDAAVVVVMVEEEKAQKTVSDKLEEGKKKNNRHATGPKDYREDGARDMGREPITGDAELLVWIMDY